MKFLLFAQAANDDVMHCIGTVRDKGLEPISNGYNGSFNTIEVENDYCYSTGSVLMHPYGFEIVFDGIFWRVNVE